MRERVFAVLAGKVLGARVLDLFAGTGAIGIEALSRGAATAVFVDSHRAAIALIRENLASLDVDRRRGVVLRRPARAAISELEKAGKVFDLIWADPPFDSWTGGLEAINAAVEAGLAATNATLCLECPAKTGVEPLLPPGLEITRDLVGGASRVVMLRIGSAVAESLRKKTAEPVDSAEK